MFALGVENRVAKRHGLTDAIMRFAATALKPSRDTQMLIDSGHDIFIIMATTEELKKMGMQFETMKLPDDVVLSNEGG